mgnify:CR=1 FL=1
MVTHYVTVPVKKFENYTVNLHEGHDWIFNIYETGEASVFMFSVSLNQDEDGYYIAISTQGPDNNDFSFLALPNSRILFPGRGFILTGEVVACHEKQIDINLSFRPR